MKRTNRYTDTSNPISNTIRHRRMDRHRGNQNHPRRPYRQTKKLWPWWALGILLVILTTCLVIGFQTTLSPWVQKVWHGIAENQGQDMNLAGVSPYGMEISNQYARDTAEEIRFGAGVFRGFNGRFNSVGEVHAAAVEENSTAWWKAYKLMLNKNRQTLDADRAAEQALQDSQPWLVIHVNACIRGDEEIRRHLETLDKVPEGTYDSIPIVRYRSHWVTRITEVSEAEYNAANDNFQGWHSKASGKRVYRAQYATSESRYFVLEIFENETKWARLVVHSYADPTTRIGLSVGGVRHDDLSIVLPKEPCTGSQGGEPLAKPTPTPAPTPAPTAVPATPTPKPTKEPKPVNPAEYVHPTEKPPAAAPVGPAATEPPNAAVVPVTAAPVAVAPTVAPAPTTAPTQVVVVIDNPPAPEPYPAAQPPAVEPGLGAQPNDGVIADPEG